MLKQLRMMPVASAVFGQSHVRRTASNFWERILNADELRDCDDLEKLLVGCEIIAALDEIDILPA